MNKLRQLIMMMMMMVMLLSLLLHTFKGPPTDSTFPSPTNDR